MAVCNDKTDCPFNPCKYGHTDGFKLFLLCYLVGPLKLLWPFWPSHFALYLSCYYLAHRYKVRSIVAGCIGGHLARGKVKSVEHALSWSLDSKQLPLPLLCDVFLTYSTNSSISYPYSLYLFFFFFFFPISFCNYSALSSDLSLVNSDLTECMHK